MKKSLLLTAALLVLAACASQSGQSSAQMYGEVKTGVESSHTH